MVSRDVHKIGLQVITERAKPVALRAYTGNKFRPALLITHISGSNDLSVLAEKGLLIGEWELKI